MVTIIIVVSTATVACFFCDLGVIMEVTGGVSASLIAFVIPSAAYLRANSLRGIKLSVVERIGHWLCMLFGGGLLVFTIVGVVMFSAESKECKW